MLKTKCKHPAIKLYTWWVGEILCIGCCQCGEVLNGGVKMSKYNCKICGDRLSKISPSLLEVLGFCSRKCNIVWAKEQVKIKEEVEYNA